MVTESARKREPVNYQLLVEVGCWTIVGLAPLLNWVDGPAVSTDQSIVRALVVTLAAVCGLGFRLRWLYKRCSGLPPIN